MADGTITFSGGLGMKVVDSVDIHKKNRSLQHGSRSGGLASSIVTTPEYYLDLYPDVRDMPSSADASHSTTKPKLVQSSVYPQRSTVATNRNQVQTITKLGDPSSPPTMTLIHNQLPFPRNPSNLISPPIKNPKSPTANPNPDATSSSDADLGSNTSLSSKPGPHSPTCAGSSPSRKLQQVFQLERARMESVDRITSFVHSIEDELHKSGINVNFCTLKDQLINIHDDSEKPSYIEGEFVEVGCNSPRHFNKSTITHLDYKEDIKNQS